MKQISLLALGALLVYGGPILITACNASHVTKADKSNDETSNSSKAASSNYEDNKKVIASATGDALIDCGRDLTWTDGILSGTTAFSSIALTPAGRFIEAQAYWGTSRINYPESQPGVVTHLTKFTNVLASAHWSSQAGINLRSGTGRFVFSAEAFPYNRPLARNVRVAAFTPDGRAIDAESYGAARDKKSSHKNRNRSQLDTIIIDWNQIFSLNLNKTGLILRVTVEGEQNYRSLSISPDVFSSTINSFTAMLNLEKDDSRNYMIKCRAIDAKPIVD